MHLSRRRDAAPDVADGDVTIAAAALARAHEYALARTKPPVDTARLRDVLPPLPCPSGAAAAAVPGLAPLDDATRCSCMKRDTAAATLPVAPPVVAALHDLPLSSAASP